ncbi:hypothetical protein Tco_1253526 [Tanacetum coccineum]
MVTKFTIKRAGYAGWWAWRHGTSPPLSLAHGTMAGAMASRQGRVKRIDVGAKEAPRWIPEFSEDEEDDDHSEQEFISSEQSDLGLHIDGRIMVNDENHSLKYPPSFTPSVEKNGSKSKDDQVHNINNNQLNGDNESVHQVEREE